MREVRVPGTIASIDDDLARRGIDVAAGDSGARRLERRGLRAVHDLKHVLHLLRGLAQHERAADVGTVAFHPAAPVHQQDRPFPHHLRRGRAVWKRRVLPHLHTRAALKAEPGMGTAHERRKLSLCHALSHRLPGGFIGREGDACRQSHQGNLVCVLDHPAARRHGQRTGQRHLRQRVRRTITELPPHRLFDTQRAGGDLARAKPLDDQVVRRVIFLPRHDFGAGTQRTGARLFERALFLELRRHQKRVALHRNDHGQQALAQPPLHAGEVVE